MWLLGAGCSAAAGVPTADQMVWEFKQLLYATEQSVAVRLLELTDERIRIKLTDHFSKDTRFASLGADAEYGAFFEAAWTDVADRRRYIERKVAGGSPSFGNLGHAVLAAMGCAPVTWTTNFDRVIEDSMARVLVPPDHLTVATVDTAHIALPAINEMRQPLLVKLHGDYQSDRLKNTSTEVQQQDSQLREALIQAAQRFGLIVVGFSGRDGAIMEALETCLAHTSHYPAGLFWCQRTDSPAGSRVSTLIENARAVGVDAHLVTIETFDELIGRLLLALTPPDRLLKMIDDLAPPTRRVPFISPGKGRTPPILRMNAIRLGGYPTVCRQLTTEIGGTRQVRQALASVHASAIAVRRRDAVIAFGRDDELKAAFAGYSAFGVGAIDTTKLFREDSTDLGLLYEALAAAIARCRGLGHRRIRSTHLLTITDATPLVACTELRAAIQQIHSRWPMPGGPGLSGQLPPDGRPWAESVAIRLEERFGSLWLVFQPTVWMHRSETPSTEEQASRTDFVRARLEHRYNRSAFRLFDAWTRLLLGDASVLTAFGIATDEGHDAAFQLEEGSAIAMTGGASDRK